MTKRICKTCLMYDEPTNIYNGSKGVCNHLTRKQAKCLAEYLPNGLGNGCYIEVTVSDDYCCDEYIN
jgi:hypothetical protein